MNTTIHFRHIDMTDHLEFYIKRRIAFAFSRVTDSVRSLVVNVSDVNGPKGGRDKQCKVLLRVDSRPDIIIVEKQSDTLFAIDRAITRASRRATQYMKRKTHGRSLRRDKNELLNNLQPAAEDNVAVGIGEARDYHY